MSRRFPQSSRLRRRYTQSPGGDWLTETKSGTVRLRQTSTGMWLAWRDAWWTAGAWTTGATPRPQGAALTRDKAVEDLERRIRDLSVPKDET